MKLPVYPQEMFVFLSVLLPFLYFWYPKIQDVKVSYGFYVSSVPYIVALGIISPKENWVLTFLACALSAFYIYRASKKIKASIKDFRTELIFGLFLSGLVIFQATLPTIQVFLKAASLTVLALSITAGILIFLLPRLVTNSFVLAIGAQYFDAASTVVALQNSLVEQRALASAFIHFLGPYGIFLMKALVIIPLLIYSKKSFDENTYRSLVYIIFALGLALGFRNIFLI